VRASIENKLLVLLQFQNFYCRLALKEKNMVLVFLINASDFQCLSSPDVAATKKKETLRTWEHFSQIRVRRLGAWAATPNVAVDGVGNGRSRTVLRAVQQ